MAREHGQAGGGPAGDSLETRRRRAQERARREREQRLTQAFSEYESIRAAKRPGYNKASKQQTGASISDPEARIRRHSAAPCAVSYNVQGSTDTAAGIGAVMEARPTAPDCEHL